MNIIKSNINFVASKLAYGNKPDTIVLHHAEASHCSVYDVDQWHKSNGWAGIGYHYFVTKTGQVYTGRPENAIGAHCPGQNDHSIGICAEGAYMTETMPEAQKQAIVDLCKYIKSKYKITKIGGHKEFYSTDCPGENYPLQEIKQAILSGKEEEKKVDAIIIYRDPRDLNAVLKLAAHVRCPIISNSVPFDFSGIKRVIGIGTDADKENYTRYVTQMIPASQIDTYIKKTK